ncbi:Fe(3+) ABC transporter substrate-binding protein [Halioglobus maricola]|uniref:Fe(3+) ABC transporter substrate-binding protein n=1 Tax=Halioglobus maricola TaxID=2601894 RepID=A0A5P9NLZ5_9GAMM|nr:Fe(3+) ABC transporter substrate-binding protein [Halioglobus maricola]QFU76274.1 Fe(3+) ABC transporter substrate-binding protein [Halioglobus maricola]
MRKPLNSFQGRLTLCATLLSSILVAPLLSAAEVNVYSARKEALIKPLLDKFTKETGVDVNLVTAKGDALLTRLKSEGANSPADVLITTDAGRLYRAQEADVLQPVESEVLQAAIPAHLRSPENYWYGLSVRARAIVFASDRVEPEALSTYEALAGPEWKGRVCIRSSGNIYNQSLVAGMLATEGADKTAQWLSSFVPNFARPPQGGDRDQIAAVAAGQCDVAVVNSYYLGAMVKSDDPAQQQAASKVGIFWPNQAGRGTHINVSGAGVVAASKNTDQAIALIEFLARQESQRWYAETNNEYPAREGVEVSDLLKSWGGFKQDQVDASELGRLNAQAVMAMDRAGWK